MKFVRISSFFPFLRYKVNQNFLILLKKRKVSSITAPFLTLLSLATRPRLDKGDFSLENFLPADGIKIFHSKYRSIVQKIVGTIHYHHIPCETNFSIHPSVSRANSNSNENSHVYPTVCNISRFFILQSKINPVTRIAQRIRPSFGQRNSRGVEYLPLYLPA